MDETPQLLLQLPTLPDERALGDLLVPHTDKGLAHDDFHWHLRRGLFYMIEQLLALHCAVAPLQAAGEAFGVRLWAFGFGLLGLGFGG